MIQRKEYLSKLLEWKEKKVIKVVTGVRRCGKSTLFALYQKHLRETGVEENQIIHLNLEDMDFEALLDYQKLYAYIKERLCVGKYTYVFIDEVQNCANFEKVVDSLFIKENVDVYITGSNAYMLSGELATLLSGRYIKIDMLPLSFREYAEGVGGTKTKSELLNDYLRFGSFPYIATSGQSFADTQDYLEGIYSSILIKDVAKREGITDVTLLENIVKTVAASIGSPISVKKIADTIVSSGRKTSVNSVDCYLKALCDAYIFYKVDRYDIKGRQYLKTLGKYYIVDTGIRNLILSTRSFDLGHLLENIVYFELLRRGYRVHIGKVAEKEVDFVAENQDGILYVQVSASVLAESTLERELASLKAISDHHPKILLTLDEIGVGNNYDGIRQLHLADWLLET
ncbi:ATP-binding protein [Chakrabartyella piscis]|uniref:ATP-binding protein n=1 Tax=Chakrabartyella piscis TaxID=2918914 RepID=UPI002958988D|nr:ATP-binding protein [Chakrabartyella piscis]